MPPLMFGIRGGGLEVGWGGVAGKRKTDTRDAFVRDFKSDLFLTLTFPKRIKHVCGILIGQDFLHHPRI